MIRPAISSDSPRASERGLRQDLSWDSPDDSRTGVNIIAFPSSLEDRREVRTATGTLGQPERRSSGRTGHFPWHWHGKFAHDGRLASRASTCQPDQTKPAGERLNGFAAAALALRAAMHL